MTLACAAPKADLILHGRILTMDRERSEAQALAVRQDRIVAVGARSEVDAWRGPQTRVIELKSATIMPGFIDAHAHIESLGREMELLNLKGTKSAEEIAAKVGEVAKTSSGWILGRGWDQNDWQEVKFPQKELLDRAAPGRPIVLTRIDGHAVWLSSAALQVSGITRATADPPGGVIQRDDAGEPTGILVDEAIALVDKHIPPPDEATRERWIRQAIDRVVQVGITGVHDMGVDEAGYRIFRRLADRGALKIRVYAVGSPEEAERLVETQPHVGEYLQRRAVKLFADGALGSRGAALLKEYSDDPGNRGLLITTRERLTAISRRALANGWQVCVHAIGDRGNRVVLDAFEEAVGERRDHRFRVEHAQVVSPEDWPRFSRLKVIASMQPTHWTSDSPWAPARLGAERLRGAYAWKSLKERGVHLAFGSDFPVEDPEPLAGVAAAIDRKEEGIDRDDALRAFMQDAAYAGFSEESLGVLRSGMRADVVAIEGDLARSSAASIGMAKVLYTIVGGRVVYEAGRGDRRREWVIDPD